VAISSIVRVIFRIFSTALRRLMIERALAIGESLNSWSLVRGQLKRVGRNSSGNAFP
jgi:hypothetical protein